MVKTLRIASIAAVVLAAAFFVFPAVFGVQREKETEQFLKSPGIIEQLGNADDRKKTPGDSQDSPLVKQAEAFALYLNPPEPKESAEGPARTIGDTPRPRTVTPKFELIGTSFYALDPQLSLALIDEPGKGFRWVRQSNKVGHLIIEQIKDGALVVRDGQNTFELVAKRPEKINLVKGTLPIGPAVAAPAPAAPVVAAPAPAAPPPAPQPVEIHPEEILAKLMAMKADAESDVNNPEYTGENAEMFDKLISEFKAMRITDQEAKKLGQLGEDLNDIYRDPNLAEDKADENNANSSEANNPQ